MQSKQKLIKAINATEAGLALMKTIVLGLSDQPLQLEQQQKPQLSYHDVSHFLRVNGVTFALVYELNFKQLQLGLAVPEVSEPLMQTHRREDILVPDAVLRYVRKSLPELKKMANMQRLKWTLRSERRAVDVMAQHKNVWAASHALTDETGRLVTAGMLRGRVKTVIPKRAKSTLRRQFSAQQVAYLTGRRNA